MKIRPLNDRIVVKRQEKMRKTATGIVIPETAGEKPEQGEVIAVGKGKRLPDGTLASLDVKVGDSVLFGKYAGTTVKLMDEELLVLREDDVLAIVESA